MGEDIYVVEDYRIAHPERGSVEQVSIIRVPKSEKFPEGIKYRLHYGYTDGEDDPIIRFDNSHGVHEKHVGDEVERIDFTGLARLYDRFREHPPEK
ncbi:DUF6516 family protein [Halomarina halobia]|uniref:DUF6516 family protein n=1 Tax=Halomarina halobia TaxID=3033386 RepID=A0ABD6AAI2_9EURY|nr:DUF6516 family protein [Halomarina sp. PSR21]